MKKFWKIVLAALAVLVASGCNSPGMDFDEYVDDYLLTYDKTQYIIEKLVSEMGRYTGTIDTALTMGSVGDTVSSAIYSIPKCSDKFSNLEFDCGKKDGLGDLEGASAYQMLSIGGELTFKKGRLHGRQTIHWLAAPYSEWTDDEGNVRHTPYDDGRVIVANYENGLLEGESRIYRDTSDGPIAPEKLPLEEVVNYKNGKRVNAWLANGTSVTYDSDGKVHGAKRWYYPKSSQNPDGTLGSIEEFHHGYRNGKVEAYKRNGKLAWSKTVSMEPLNDANTFYYGNFVIKVKRYKTNDFAEFVITAKGETKEGLDKLSRKIGPIGNFKAMHLKFNERGEVYETCDELVFWPSDCSRDEEVLAKINRGLASKGGKKFLEFLDDVHIAAVIPLLAVSTRDGNSVTGHSAPLWGFLGLLVGAALAAVALSVRRRKKKKEQVSPKVRGKELDESANSCVECEQTVDDPPCSAPEPLSFPGEQADEKTGTVPTNVSDKPMPSPKSRDIAGLLCLFGGHWGVHNFYCGEIKTGIVKICLSLTGIGLVATSLWQFVDIIRILAGDYEDAWERKLEGKAVLTVTFIVISLCAFALCMWLWLTA